MRRQFLLVVLVGMLLGMLSGCAAPTPPVELLIPVNARCATCESFVRCEGTSGNAAVYDPSFDIFHLERKGIGAQLATVGEFLLQLFYTRTEDVRPLSIYAQRPGDTAAFSRSVTNGAEARIDLVRNRISVPGGWIDQVTGEWRSVDDAPRGSCRLLAPVDGREALKLFAGAPGRSTP